MADLLESLSLQERDEIARRNGFKNIDEFVRKTLANEKKKLAFENREAEPGVKLAFETPNGKIFQGDSLYYLKKLDDSSVDLIVTSPPYGLLRKKDYGNEDAHIYCDWFRAYAKELIRVLKDSGSLVIDIGGTWKKGVPSRSLYHFELLIMLCEEYGFNLCLEHFWWNSAKLPSPAEWVNIRRIRPKDSVNCIWWLSKTHWPKASNRRVLSPYSSSMKKLFANGYNDNPRPSGHKISSKFGVDNGGAVPPNLLAIANTESNGSYQEYCRSNNIKAHPARFPSLIPEYFIKMTTEPGDLVIDPFGGSCVTGAVAEKLGRRWVCIEKDNSYIEGAKGRFVVSGAINTKHVNRVTEYQIFAPCSLPVDESSTPLAPDGGAQRPKVE